MVYWVNLKDESLVGVGNYKSMYHPPIDSPQRSQNPLLNRLIDLYKWARVDHILT